MARKTATKQRKQPSQGRSRFTVQQIVQAAARVFEQRGFAGTTTNHIAARAGVSVGSLYQYFPNKESILVVLLEQHMRQVAEAFEEIRRHVEAEPHDIEGVLRHFVDAMLSLHSQNPRLQHVLLEEAPRPPHMRQMQQQIEQAAVASALAMLRANPQVQVEDVETAAYLVVHAVETLTHAYVAAPPEQLDPRRFSDGVAEMMVRYLMGTVS